jgi:DNA topoisomerase-1
MLETMKTDLEIGDQPFTFTRKRMAKLGWREHYPYRKVENDEFPDLKEGNHMEAIVYSEEKETKPPARYNQASLIRELEKRGLGTKSTRANIISLLYDRKYIEGKKITVNKLGEHLIDTLKKYSEKITSEKLTREFETKLEDIMGGQVKKYEIIDEAKAEVSFILDDIEKNKIKIGGELYEAYRESMIVGKCKCGGNLIMINSPKGGSFVGCSNYPQCKSTYSMPRGATVLKTKCDKCGLPMISFGKPRQRACMDPKCGRDGEEPSQNEVVGICPECGKDLLKRTGRYGEFIGCSSFPHCRYTRSLEEKTEKSAEKS